jgi:hypothetical protein
MNSRSTLGLLKRDTKALNFFWLLASLLWVVFGSILYSGITGQLPTESNWLRKVLYSPSLSSLGVKVHYGVFYLKGVVSAMSTSGIL